MVPLSLSSIQAWVELTVVAHLSMIFIARYFLREIGSVCAGSGEKSAKISKGADLTVN